MSGWPYACTLRGSAQASEAHTGHYRDSDSIRSASYTLRYARDDDGQGYLMRNWR